MFKRSPENSKVRSGKKKPGKGIENPNQKNRQSKITNRQGRSRLRVVEFKKKKLKKGREEKRRETPGGVMGNRL